MAPKNKADEATTSEKTSKKAERAKRKAEEAQKPIPVVREKNGELKDLKKSDFPKTKDGQIAWWDYVIAKAEEAKKDILLADDPKEQLRRQKAKFLKRAENIDKKLAELNKGKVE